MSENFGWTRFVAQKFWRQGRRRGIRLVSLLAILGIALGVATLTLTQSVLTGMEKIFRESILGFNAHLVVLKLDEMENPERELQRIQDSLGVFWEGVTPFLYREGLVVSQGKVKGVVLKGIDPGTFSRVYHVKLKPLAERQERVNIKELLGSPDEIPNLLLGEDLANILGIQESRPLVRVFLPKQESTEGEGGDRFVPFRVTGTFSTGLKEFDSGFALFLRPGEKASGLEFSLKDPDQAEKLANRLKGILGYGYDAISWQRLNAPLFHALRLERALFFVVMAMVVLVASFNIIGVLVLMIFDKAKEISILRALGAPYRGLKRLFSFQGLWIGFLGCFWGILIGWILGLILKKTQILKLTKEVYFIGEFPVEFSAAVLLTVVGASLLIAYVATRLAVSRLHRAPLDL